MEGDAQVGPWPDGQMWGAAFEGWCAFLAELPVVSEPQGDLDRVTLGFLGQSSLAHLCPNHRTAHRRKPAKGQGQGWSPEVQAQRSQGEHPRWEGHLVRSLHFSTSCPYTHHGLIFLPRVLSGSTPFVERDE